MRQKQQVLETITKLGVSNPINPSSKDITLIMEAYLKNKELDVETFKMYQGIVTPALANLFEGLKQFSSDETNIARDTISLINKAIEILSAELVKNPRRKERKNIRDQIFNLIIEARKESDQSRRFKTKLLYVAGTVTAAIIGGSVYLIKKAPRYIAKGLFRI